MVLSSKTNPKLSTSCLPSPANVGPPTSVSLAPAGSDLDVLIADPLTSTNVSMRERAKDLFYSIVYWERFAETEVGAVGTLGLCV